MTIRTILFVLALPIVLFSGSCKNKKDESREHFLKANEFLFKEDFAAAKNEYSLALKADSTNWEACYQVASIFELEGDYRGAYFFFNKTVEINPKFALGFYNKSNLEEALGAEKESMKDLKKAVSLKGDLFSARLSIARKEYAGGNLKQAVRDFDTAIDQRKDYYLAYSMRGSCKFKAGDYEGAVNDFGMEIQLNPNHGMGYVNRSMAYAAQNNFRAAIYDLNVAINIDPLWTPAYLYRGVAYNKLNVKDSSCGDFQMAKKLKNPEAENYMKEYCK